MILNMNMKTICVAVVAALSSLSALAQNTEDKWEKWGPQHESGAEFVARVGYSFGGTTPMPLPGEIRAIKGFSPKGGGIVALDVTKMFCRRVGVTAGWHLFHQGFHTKAEVKNYKMSLTMDGNTMAGYFTGTDVTNIESMGMTIPVQATVRVSPRWNISAGPYVNVLFKTKFDGEVYDNSKGVGYLRVDTPTGEKVNMDRNNPATYDFSDNMRTWNAGLEFTFDYKATRHLNVFAMLDWGLSDAIEPDFDAVAFKMYPIYATLGLGYRF